ncbi:MAG: phenylalanine--tRNA ligase subunit beta [Bacteroidota bacterium]
MKISYNWLRQYIDCDWAPEEMADRLTMTGLEVEGTETYDSIEGGLEGVVVGEVKTHAQHPNADRLSVCTVDVGAEELLNIVCGAPNVAAGQKVAVGLVGTTLYPTEGNPFTLKKSKIRGEVSMGMICAEDELGLGTDHDGIMVLDPSLVPGTPAAEVFAIERDIVFEIGLTPNRVDAASHFGVARDLAALLRKEGKPATLPEIPELDPESPVKNPVQIDLPEPDRCPRFVGVYFQGVTIKDSPEWMQNRLKAIGLRPINNVVDITNFVLHELGQPLHAYDADKIRGNRISAQTLPKNTKFRTLDGTEREIRGGIDLMICDGEGPVGVAGVMGGLDSEVTAETSNVFLEGAYFVPGGIRRTAAYLGLKSDASYRFERGVDPNGTRRATLRATALILELAGGTASVEDDHGQTEFEYFSVEFDLNRARILMGYDFAAEEAIGILESLEMKVEDRGAGKYHVQVPPYRVDVTRPQDVMEEILRIHGYNNIPLPTHSRLSYTTDQDLDVDGIRQKYFNALSASGFNELVTNPLIPATYAKDSTANLINNLSEDMAVLRDNMLYTGLQVVAHNHNRQNLDLRLFEYGKTYGFSDPEYHEQEWIAFYLTGASVPVSWQGKALSASLFTLTREMERLQRFFGFFAETKELENDPEFAYGLAVVKGEKVIARLGKVADALTDVHGIDRPVFFAQIDWRQVVRQYRKAKVKFAELPKFPGLRRDVSMIVPEEVTFRNIEAVIRKANPKLIREIGITDVYKGPNIEAGKKSYLVNISMLDEKKTLNDKAADKVMRRVFQLLENELQLEIRK